ncbi:MAG: anthrone oxygenase family protein [Acidimicrobiales bacterium]
MDLLTFVTLVVTGFTGCAEFGSYALVHPVIRRLAPADHIRVEQGFLRTWGRVMPILMPLTAVLNVALASLADAEGATLVLRWVAAAAVLVSVVTTVSVNVGINIATGRWDADHPPADWKAVRARWERFQAIRSWLLVVAFVLQSLTVTVVT